MTRFDTTGEPSQLAEPRLCRKAFTDRHPHLLAMMWLPECEEVLANGYRGPITCLHDLMCFVCHVPTQQIKRAIEAEDKDADAS